LNIAILGAGAAGAAATAELTLAGHSVALWNRSADTLAPFQARGGVAFEGVLGAGLARPALITADLRQALLGADVALVTLPTLAHPALATALAETGWTGPVVLNPGHTGGALEFAQSYREAGCAPPPVAEFSTLTYIARKLQPGAVTITGAAKQVRMGWLPGGESAAALARTLYPCALPVADVLAANLANANMVLHPPGAVMAAAWVEATCGDFTFYVQAMTPGVARVMRRLDDERLAVAAAFGHDLPSVVGEMKAIGTVAADVPDDAPYEVAISGGAANARIKAPDSLAHRYYREDFGHGVLPFLELAQIAGVAVPVAAALFAVAEAALATDFRSTGRTAAAMGIAGLTREGLMDLVRHR